MAVYDDRIEIWNPGELPKQLTPQLLKGKHRSIPRNQFLADSLYLIKYIERWGRGTTRIVEGMRAEKLPDPLFSNNSGGFEIVLRGPGKSFGKKIEDVKLHNLVLNARQKKAMDCIKRKGFITRNNYMTINRVSHTLAHRELKDLLTQSILVTRNAGKYLRYELTQG